MSSPSHNQPWLYLAIAIAVVGIVFAVPEAERIHVVMGLIVAGFFLGILRLL